MKSRLRMVLNREVFQGVGKALSTPDRGRQLYLDSCSACHGPGGNADGFADPEMEPPATSFRDERMSLLSPRQVYGAMAFGIDGTAMPSYFGALDPQQLWDIAFHVLTLREGFAPDRTEPGLPITLDALVAFSNDALAKRLSTTPSSIDY